MGHASDLQLLIGAYVLLGNSFSLIIRSLKEIDEIIPNMSVVHQVHQLIILLYSAAFLQSE